MTIVRKTSLEGVIEIIPARYEDDRGFFSETYNQRELIKYDINTEFVQDNHSYSRHAGVLRGLHFQKEPFGQIKLIWVTQGSIFDVAVDIRQGSPNYGKWIGLEISAKKGNQLLVPHGFAHGFLTLEPNTDTHYKVSSFYKASEDRSVHYNDPDIGINWPAIAQELIVSPKDEAAPYLSQVDNNHKFRKEPV